MSCVGVSSGWAAPSSGGGSSSERRSALLGCQAGALEPANCHLSCGLLTINYLHSACMNNAKIKELYTCASCKNPADRARSEADSKMKVACIPALPP